MQACRFENPSKGAPKHLGNRLLKPLGPLLGLEVSGRAF